MTLSLTIAFIVLADMALIAGLAYVMSRARLLTPHLVAGASGPVAARVAQPVARAPRPRAAAA